METETLGSFQESQARDIKSSILQEKIQAIREEYSDIMVNPDKAELFDVYHKHFEYLLELAEERVRIE